MTDVLIINWLTSGVVKDSLRVLTKEKDINVILVNVEENDPEGTIFLPENKGVSIARNAGLEISQAPLIFLLDGDIQYIKGTIPWMIENMTNDMGCLGVHNINRWNGTRDKSEADVFFPYNPGKIYDDFPMAWTQYGLFQGDWLRKNKFVTEGVFGEAGNGWEDNWLHNNMLKDGLRSCYISDVMYYHQAHAGNRNLATKGIDNKNKERKALFDQHWGI